jgi:oligopeptidase B
MNAPPSLEPPVAPRRPTVLRLHGDERVDDWFWLRERENPEVRVYLEAENAYTDAATAHTRELRERLFAEFKHRVVETDASVPARKGEFWHYRRTVEGLEYPIHCRRAGSEDGPEEVMLDENELAAGHEYLHVTGLAVSPDGRLLAYAVDTTGGERFTLRVRDLDSGRDLGDEIPDVYYGLAWANDCRTIFYTRPDKAMRPWQVWRHELGRPVSEDALVVQEEDEQFFVDVSRTRSDRYLVLTFESNVTTEIRVLPADDPAAEPRVVVPRRRGVEAGIEDAGDRLLVLTNDGAPDFRLLDEHGAEVVPERPGVRLAGVTALAGRLVVSERTDAIQRLRVGDAVLDQPEDVYTAAPGENLEFESDVFRFRYTSLVTPETTVDVDLGSLGRQERKRVPIRDYDPAQYAAERLWATAGDGTRVPISVVRRRDRPPGGPLLLYGYGSYELPILPSFSPLRLSLLDRGFAWAIAHVRGGGELGRRWYEGGKLAHKRNTFTDFVACAELLIAEGWTSPAGLVARGRSAGGLLMGAIANLRPDLFAAVVAEVPFVDAVTTMLDDSIPLTSIEWDEWGDPRTAEFYEVMKSYSPYDNVEPKAYPRMLVTAGLNDPRVAYWEPAKWVAKLRAVKTDPNLLLLKTQLGAGHAGPSARYDAWREEAFVYAFILDAVGLA